MAWNGQVPRFRQVGLSDISDIDVRTVRGAASGTMAADIRDLTRPVPDQRNHRRADMQAAAERAVACGTGSPGTLAAARGVWYDAQARATSSLLA